MFFWCDEFENDKFESDKFILTFTLKLVIFKLVIPKIRCLRPNSPAPLTDDWKVTDDSSIKDLGT